MITAAVLPYAGKSLRSTVSAEESKNIKKEMCIWGKLLDGVVSES